MKWFLALFLFAPISGWGQANMGAPRRIQNHHFAFTTLVGKL